MLPPRKRRSSREMPLRPAACAACPKYRRPSRRLSSQVIEIRKPRGVSTLSTLEFGLDTFLPVTVDRSGNPIGGDQVIRNTVEEAVLAEAVGIDSFNIGEHYRTELIGPAGDDPPRPAPRPTEKKRARPAGPHLCTQRPRPDD